MSAQNSAHRASSNGSGSSRLKLWRRGTGLGSLTDASFSDTSTKPLRRPVSLAASHAFIATCARDGLPASIAASYASNGLSFGSNSILMARVTFMAAPPFHRPCR